MVYNLWRTARSGAPVNGTIQIPAVAEAPRLSFGQTFLNAPVVYSFLIIVSLTVWFIGNDFWTVAGLFSLSFWVFVALAHFELRGATWGEWYAKLLNSSMSFTVLTFVAVAIGGAIQIIPTVTLQTGRNLEGRVETPLSPLELAGRDIYVREGCYTCHSQMIRTLLPDVLRYGDYSRLGESIYDHPYQWGSKRLGPDLAREGGVRGDDWHFLHFQDPRSTSPGSLMPKYPWLFADETDYAALPGKINALRILGVPYPLTLTPAEIDRAAKDQAKTIADGLKKPGKDLFTEPNREVVAVIAYLQRMGKNTQDQTSTRAVTATPVTPAH
jgi:cytochrome c oxidase cbb3-type subunit I/II